MNEKIFYYCSIVLFSVTLFLGRDEDTLKIQLLDFDILPNPGYTDYLYPKKKLEKYFPAQFWASFTDELKCYDHSPMVDQKKDIFNCEKSVKNLRRDYSRSCKASESNETEEGFNQFWKKNLELCHLKYIEAAPVINFKFHNIGSNKIICDSVFVFVYSSSASYSSKAKYFNNKIDDIEQIVVNPDILYEDQYTVLSNILVTDEAVFSIPLRFISEKYWSGYFDKNTFILEIKFNFIDNKNGNRQIVKTDPFIIDI